MQPGGRRFDPGHLHLFIGARVAPSTGKARGASPSPALWALPALLEMRVVRDRKQKIKIYFLFHVSCCEARGRRKRLVGATLLVALFENFIFPKTILLRSQSRDIYLSLQREILKHFYGQAIKSVRWMPRRKLAMKDVSSCDKLRGVAKRTLIRRFLNGATLSFGRIPY